MKSANKILTRLGLLAALSCSSGLLFAQPAEDQGGPRKPPQEALDACKSLSAGQECGFTSRTDPSKVLLGASKPLACKPKDAPGGRSQPQKQ